MQTTSRTGRGTIAGLLVATALAAAGCTPFGLGGTIDGEELEFVEAVYFELRATDPATATPFHDIHLWLTAMEDSCTRLPALLDELASLRAQQAQAGLPPVDYCNAWEDIMAAYVGREPFWHAQVRMKALPRGEDVTPQTTYGYHDETSLDLADAPNFDAQVLYYPTPDFDACAEEFSGDSSYTSTSYPANGGTAEIVTYNEDNSIDTTLEMSLDGASNRQPFSGRSKASFCIAAQDWPLSFGLGI